MKFSGSWYSTIIDKLVLKTHTEFGYLGAYNNDLGIIPFERFYLGGDGLSQYALDGRETIAMRGYENQSLSDRDGATIYNKFSLELRYPITLKPSPSIFALSFLVLLYAELIIRYTGISKVVSIIFLITPFVLNLLAYLLLILKINRESITK